MASGGLDWAFISVAPASRLASTSYLPAFVRAGLPHHSQFEDLRPTVISFRSIASFSLLTPSLPFGPVHPSIHCIYLPSPPPLSPPLSPTGVILLIPFTVMARRSGYQIRPPPKEVFPESTLSPGGLQLTTLFWDTGILFHQGSHAGARVGNNFEVFGCVLTRVSISPLFEFDGRGC